MYKVLVNILNKIFEPDKIFRYGFNLSPMYRRSVGKINEVSKDLHFVKVEVPLNYKNRNYVGAIFGGSMFSATDPVFMIQLIHILGDKYVVWDKAATIRYKRPAKEKAYAIFEFSKEEISEIKQKVSVDNEIDIVKHLELKSIGGTVFAELDKTLYISTKDHYKAKLAKRKSNQKDKISE